MAYLGPVLLNFNKLKFFKPPQDVDVIVCIIRVTLEVPHVADPDWWLPGQRPAQTILNFVISEDGYRFENGALFLVHQVDLI